MKFLRFLLKFLVFVIVLGVLLVGIAFVPAVQTMVAQHFLDRQPGLKGTVGSVWVGFGKVDITDLHVEAGGAIVTMPAVTARLPLITAFREHRFLLKSLIAQGWTLDVTHLGDKPDKAPLSGGPRLASASSTGPRSGTSASPTQQAASAFNAVLRRWALPFEGSADGVELEGDIVVVAHSGMETSHVHVILSGGGVAAGREGAFNLDASGESAELPLGTVGAHGQLLFTLDSQRILTRVAIQAVLAAKSGFLPSNLALSAEVAAPTTHEETLSLNLTRGGRHLATLVAHSAEGAPRLTGTWKIDLQDSDLAAFAQDRPLLAFAVAGEGPFDADAALKRVHLRGRLKGNASRLAVLAAPLERLGTVTMESQFDLARTAESIRFDQLNLSLAAAAATTSVRFLQPFELDPRTGISTATDPDADWIEVSMRQLPLAWISSLIPGIAVAGDPASGDFIVRYVRGGFALRTKTPLTAANVSVQSGGRTLGRGVDLSLPLIADTTPDGWHVQSTPFTISARSQRLVTLNLKASRGVDASQPIALSGSWTADLDGLASQPIMGEIPWIRGRTASGDFTANRGTWTSVEASLAITGHEAGHSITGTARADVDDDGTISLSMPLKIAFGPKVSDIAIEGTWTSNDSGTRPDFKLTGKDVILEHARMLVGPFSGAVEIHARAGVRDPIPFWGVRPRRVSFAFDQLRTSIQDYDHVTGSLEIDRGSLHLVNGHAGLPNHSGTTVQGSISFDAAAPFPYSMKATVSATEIDSAAWVGKPAKGEEPVLEGHFTVESTLTGYGINLDDLISRRQEEFRLTSTNGILRLLKTSVAESIPQVSTPVSDTLGTAGSLVGTLLGVKRDNTGAGKNPVSKTAEAILDFTNQIGELGYDRMTLTAIRGLDRTLHLMDIVITTPDEHLSGSGLITYAADRPLPEQPLSLEFQFSARGRVADLLVKGGLPVSAKDKSGFASLTPLARFGGTLEHVDASPWQALLAKAVTAQPATGKK